MEPLKLTITSGRAGQPKVYLFTHDGLRRKTMLPVENGTFTIDGTRDKTPSYLLEF